MVTYKNTSRFYARHSNGKYQLKVHDIRSAFALSEDLRTRLRNFRLDRLAKIEGRETPVPLADQPKVIIHIVPVAALQGMNAVDVKSVPRRKDWLELASTLAVSHTRFNLDGFLGYGLMGDPESRGHASHYVQIFRDGVVEAVDAFMLRRNRDRELWIPYVSLENQFVPFCARALTLQRSLGIEPPTLIFWSMMGVRGFKMPSDDLLWHTASEVIDRDALLLPEVWLEQYPNDLVTLVEALRTPFDALWNATGFQGWLTYERCRKSAEESDRQRTGG